MRNTQGGGMTSAVAAPSRAAASAWILYDVASSAYALMIPSVAYAVYFRSYVAGDSAAADALWAIAVALPLIAAGLLGPLVGALADVTGHRGRLLGLATVASAGATALLSTVGKGDVLLGTSLFFVAQLAYMTAVAIYDSYLPFVAAPGRAGRLSGLGWGLGYLGAVAVFFVTLPLTRGGLSEATAQTFARTFLVTGAFYFVLALPALAALPRPPGSMQPEDAGGAVAQAYERILTTLRAWRHDREIPKLLVAFYLVNDGIVTATLFIPIFLKITFGVPVEQILQLTLLFHFTAIPATILFGWLADRWSQRGAIYVTLVIWAGILALMMLGTGPWVPTALALTLGLVIGSTQSLFRSLFVRMVPRERASEYFGFHGLVGRVSAALGPLVFGLVSAGTGNQRLAMLSIGFFMLAGAWMLSRLRIPGAKADES